MKSKARLFQFMSLATMAQPLVATGHPLHWASESLGFFSGLTHPLTSSDHIITTLVVGFWLSQLNKPAAILLSAVFVSFMLIGCSLTLTPIGISNAENIMNLLALMLGIVLITSYQTSLLIALLIISNLAFFHGYVHAYDIWLDKNGVLFTTGFVLTTLILITLGMAINILIDRYAIKNANDFWGGTLDR